VYWESFWQLIGKIIEQKRYKKSEIQNIKENVFLFLFFKLLGCELDPRTRTCEEGAQNRPRHSIPPLPRVFAAIPAAPNRLRFRQRSGTVGGCEIANSYDPTS